MAGATGNVMAVVRVSDRRSKTGLGAPLIRGVRMSGFRLQNRSSHCFGL